MSETDAALLRMLLRRTAGVWASIGFTVGAALGCFGTALTIH